MIGRKKAKALSLYHDHDGRVLHGIRLADWISEMEEANRKRKRTTGAVLGVFGVVHLGFAILIPDPILVAGLVLDFGLISSAYAWYHRRLRKKIEVKQDEFEEVTSSHTALSP